MVFEVIPLYSEKYITAGEIRRSSEQTRVAKTEKMCLKDQKQRHKNVRYVPEKGCVKKGNKRRNGRTRLLQEERAFHKRYFQFGNLWNRSKWSVIEPLGHSGNYHI